MQLRSIHCLRCINPRTRIRNVCKYYVRHRKHNVPAREVVKIHHGSCVGSVLLALLPRTDPSALTP
jgi:hypothetical protein